MAFSLLPVFYGHAKATPLILHNSGFKEVYENSGDPITFEDGQHSGSNSGGLSLSDLVSP